MTLRWNRMWELEDMQKRLNRLFGEAPSPNNGDDGLFFANWSPAIDIEETDREYLVKADLPDVKKEDVKVELLDGSLTIEGERKQEREEKGKSFHRVERAYGKFVRRFGLPNEVDASKAQAEFKEGVLNVHLPKSPTIKPKVVDIRVS